MNLLLIFGKNWQAELVQVSLMQFI